MKWWEESVDEMWIGFMVAIIACVALLAKHPSTVAVAVASGAVSGLVVYLGVKPGKKIGGQNVNEETIVDTGSTTDGSGAD